MCVSAAQSCPALRDTMDCSPPGSSVCGSLQARILESVASPFSIWPYLLSSLKSSQVWAQFKTEKKIVFEESWNGPSDNQEVCGLGLWRKRSSCSDPPHSTTSVNQNSFSLISVIMLCLVLNLAMACRQCINRIWWENEWKNGRTVLHIKDYHPEPWCWSVGSCGPERILRRILW